MEPACRTGNTVLTHWMTSSLSFCRGMSLTVREDPVVEEDTGGAVSEHPEDEQIKELPNLREGYAANLLIFCMCVELVEELHFTSSATLTDFTPTLTEASL